MIARCHIMTLPHWRRNSREPISKLNWASCLGPCPAHPFISFSQMSMKHKCMWSKSSRCMKLIACGVLKQNMTTTTIHMIAFPSLMKLPTKLQPSWPVIFPCSRNYNALLVLTNCNHLEGTPTTNKLWFIYSRLTWILWVYGWRTHWSPVNRSATCDLLQDTKSGSTSAAKSSGGAWATHSWVRVRPVETHGFLDLRVSWRLGFHCEIGWGLNDMGVSIVMGVPKMVGL